MRVKNLNGSGVQFPNLYVNALFGLSIGIEINTLMENIMHVYVVVVIRMITI